VNDYGLRDAVGGLARQIGVAEQKLRNWCKAQAAGKLASAEKGKPITPEQMEISRLGAENARLKMEAEIPKKPPRSVGVTLGAQRSAMQTLRTEIRCGVQPRRCARKRIPYCRAGQ
jgi:transposase-like protein